MQTEQTTQNNQDRPEQGVRRSIDVFRIKVAAQGTFLRAMERWGLTERQVQNLLGQGHENAPDATVFSFDNQLREREVRALNLTADVLEVYVLCRRIFGDDMSAARWLRTPSNDAGLCGLAPITWIVHCGSYGATQVRDCLEARLQVAEAS